MCNLGVILTSMRITLNELCSVIRDIIISEAGWGGPRGKLRTSQRMRDSKWSNRQVKIGRVEDENGPISSIDAELMFPGAVDAWVEIVPEYFPEFPFADDPVAIRRGSAWYKIGNELRVGFKDIPDVELAIWNPRQQDWVLTSDLDAED